MKRISLNNNHGFTLLELLMAMTLFSAVMVIATAGFIAMNRTFTRGVIKKEISESAQALNEDITRTIRIQGKNSNALNCNSGDTGCPSSTGWSAVCLGSVRYIWQSADNGMYKDSKTCNESVDNNKLVVFSDRFRVRAFTVNKVSGKEGLFSVRGVVTTLNEDALTTPSGSSPFDITCKGTAQSSAVNTCAVEKFEFVINAQQSAVEV